MLERDCMLDSPSVADYANKVAYAATPYQQRCDDNAACFWLPIDPNDPASLTPTCHANRVQEDRCCELLKSIPAVHP